MKNFLHIADLINKHIRQELNEKERQILHAWLQTHTDNQELFNKITSHTHQLSKLEIYRLFNKNKVWSDLEKKLSENKVIYLFSRKTLRYAASILLPFIVIGGFGIYYVFNQKQQNGLSNVDEFIKPGAQKAILVLSDGVKVNLTEQTESIEEKGAIIENKENKLSYTSKNIESGKKEILYNELRTPAGGTYNLKLADGTEVWLNAGSILKFPVEFFDSIRKVYLTGEGYFDVTHTGIPFVVALNNANVRVLGTSFNISAYDDEKLITTTLVEGKIAFEANKSQQINSSHVLTPGLQAVMSKLENNVEINEVNTSSYTSWKEGKLEFNNEELELVVKKMARWYNFEYKFENESAKNYHFTARFNSRDSISNILNMLELTTNVRFKLENNTIVIL